MPEAIVIFKGSEAEPLTYQVKVDGRPLPLGSSTAKFKMRNANSDDLVVDEDAEVVDADAGKLKYVWSDSDIDTQGEYFAWFEVAIGSSNLDTPEFYVIVTHHAPGLRKENGAIYRSAKTILPITFSHLENSEYYGDAFLQEIVEVAKLRVLGEATTVAEEASLDIRVQRFIAKIACIEIIPGAIDYWMNQHQSMSATGTAETVTYTDRVLALRDQLKRLKEEVAAERPIIEDIIDLPTLRSSEGTPAFSEGTDIGFVTPLPGKHFRDYAFPETSGNLAIDRRRGANRGNSGSLW